MKTKARKKRIVVLSPKGPDYAASLGSLFTLCRSEKDIAKIYEESVGEDITWVTLTLKLTDSLIAVTKRDRARRLKPCPRRIESLLAVKPPRPTSVPALQGLFDDVVGESPEYRWLPPQQLIEVLMASSEERSRLFLAVATDSITRSLALIRGDFKRVVVPFDLFKTSGDGVCPDFARPSITDYGHAIAFGEYEASADAILYETDADYRKQLNEQRKASERSFGASLRRLRLQRRLTQDDFPGITAKTVARIERGEVGKPHRKTLTILAETLGVTTGDIESY